MDAAVTLLETIINTDEAALRKNIAEKSFAPNVADALETLNLNEASVLDNDSEFLKKQRELESQQSELESLQRAFDKDVPVEPLQKKQKIISELRKKDVYRDWIRRIMSAFQYELVSLSLVQTRTRLEAITLEPNSMTPETALDIASANRLDWMNQRCALQDAKRHIDIAADRLKGGLNVTFDGKLGTVDQNGVDFGSKTGQMMLGLAWDSPLTRHNEMLDYRRAEIAYQDARRDYYTFVDSVNAQLRQTLRGLQIHQIEFEIARNAILTDAVRVDVMQLRMEQPPQRGQKIDTSTARDLISALNGLMDSQNTFLDTWVRYQTQRMLLDLNTGTMQLNNAGHWIQTPDENKKTTEPTAPTLAPIPIPTLNKRYI
jgi:outer membrane protein TolC